MNVEMRKERMKVLAVEHALRRETQRASRLAQELKRVSIKRESPAPLSPGCTYKVNHLALLVHCVYDEMPAIYSYMYNIMYTTYLDMKQVHEIFALDG